MPLYEYRCEHCRKKTEVIQNYSEKPLKICPHCGERKLKKLMSAPAIQFKGSGWYVTDYAGKSGSDRGGESSESASEKEDKAGKAAEKKSEKPAKPEKPARKGAKKD
ncbi:MAG TPA: zinc ribbon domain-containing protein [Thermoanaerobaculia bacterium]|nr:zinc ribbon domain-containing protein [Thermoanaerobaculia bacterium]